MFSIPKDLMKQEKFIEIWLTLILCQLLDPSFVLTICMEKILFELHNKNIFIIN